MQAVHRLGGVTMFVMTSINKTPTKTKSGKEKDGSTQKKEDKSEKMKRIECFGCHKMGHYANKCPLRKTQEKVEEDGNKEVAYHVNDTWQSVIFNTTGEVSVHSALDPRIKIEPDDIILDNRANISIFTSKLLRKVKPSEDVKVHGTRGLSMVVNKTRYLDGFFRVHANETTKIKMLSYAEVEDKYEITCIHGQGFIVNTEDRDILFVWVGKLYVAKWDAILGEAKT